MEFILGFIGMFFVAIMAPAIILSSFDLLIYVLFYLCWLVIGFSALFANDKLFTSEMKENAVDGLGALAASKLMLRILFWFKYTRR